MKGDIHVIPERDIQPHVSERGCWCWPIADTQVPTVFIHNSADGREFDEREAEIRTQLANMKRWS